MSKSTRLLIQLAALVVFVIAILGGALGEAFGFGFIGAPLATIALPAEPVIGGFILTNTMIATWIALIVLIAIALKVRSGMSEVPGRFQGMVEVFIEFFLDLAERIAGHDRARQFFPLVMTIFLFIFVANWIGILPGFGTIGRVETVEEVVYHHHCYEYHYDSNDTPEQRVQKANDCAHHTKVQVFQGDGGFSFLPFGSVGESGTATADEWGHYVAGADGKPEWVNEQAEPGKRAGLLVPFFRSANTDINTTLAVAIVAMVMIHFWGFKTLGFASHAGKFINVRQGPMWLFVGLLELISEFARLISFTFRLFGNIFAGEVLLAAMIFLLPLIGIVPFLGLELFVGLIQAFIFSMLTLVFAASATVAHDADH